MTGFPHTSMREQRTLSDMHCRDYITHSHSDSADLLKTKPSDDSSLFSGLIPSSDQNHHNYSANCERNIPPPPPIEDRKSKKNTQKGILQATHHNVSKKESLAATSSDSDIFQVDYHTGSSLNDRSQRNAMRDMPPMVDSDTIFSRNSISLSSMGRRNDTLSTATSNDSMMNELVKNIKNVDDLFPDGDSNTQMTWASAKEMPRPKGTIKLVSSVMFAGDQIEEGDRPDHENNQSINNCKSDDSDSNIVDLLNDFEKQMDANLKIVDEDNDENNVLSDLKDSVTRWMQSEDAGSDHFLTPHKARKLQKILHKTRKEAEVLRDNNEQFKSEIEQMEEEHKSEIKLIDDRARQKLGELKKLYQGEINDLALEKDAAIIEAGRGAARYAETGKKQVCTMQKQINRLKAAAMVTIKEQVEKARRDATTNKDNEITARLGALRNSYENELENVTKEFDQRVKNEVENAVSSVSKRVRLNRDVLNSELRDQIDNLQRERNSMVDLLKSVKIKFEKQYPEEMIQYKEKPDNFLGNARRLLDDDNSSNWGAKKDFKEVIETFTFLLEATKEKLSSAQTQTAIQESEKKSTEVQRQMREYLVLRHRAEIEHLKKEKGETYEKLRKVEKDFKNISFEKRLLEEKHQKVLENHQMELERLTFEKKTVLDIEKSRKDLEHAMATGKRELVHHKVTNEEYQFAASFMNGDKRRELDVQVSNTEMRDRDPLEMELQYSLSIPTPKTTFEEKKGLERCDRKIRTFNSPKSPSVRRARYFQKNHPLHSPCNSPRPQDLVQGLLTRKQPNTIPHANQITSDIDGTNMHRSKSEIVQAVDDKNMSQAHDTSVVEFARGTLSNIDSNLDTSNSSIRSSDSALPDHRNRVRETEDQVFIIVNTMSDEFNNTSKSDMSTNKSIRSKDNTLSNLRNQSKKANQNEDLALKEARDRYKENSQGNIDIKTKKSKNAENPIFRKGEEDNELAANPPKKNNFEILRNFKSKREYKTLYATEKEVDNKKESTNIMIRSLRRARNFKNYLDPNKQDVPSKPARKFIDDNISSLRTNTGFTNKETEESGSVSEENQTDSRISHALNARQSDSYVEVRDERDQIENNSKKIEAPTSAKRGINTLGMFAQVKKNMQPENMPESKSVSSELDFNGEQIIIPPLSPSEYSNNDMKDKMQNVLTGRSHVESKVEPFGECTTRLNLKKPPLVAKHELYSMKGSLHSRIYSGNKEGLRLDNISGKKVKDNSEIAVDSIFTMENDSNHSGTENYTPTTFITLHSPAKKSHAATACGHTSTFETTNSSNDESRLVYESQTQMRKVPPLTDDSEDEENGVCIQDKYQTIDSPNVGSGLSSSTENSNTRPKSVDEDSVRAHTGKTASFLRDNKRNNNRSRKGLPLLSKNSSSNGSARFTAFKARVRVRKAEVNC